MRRYEAVVQDITPTSYDITVWRIEDGERREAFGEPVWYDGGLDRLVEAIDERLRAADWRRTDGWQVDQSAGTMTAEVEPVVRD